MSHAGSLAPAAASGPQHRAEPGQPSAHAAPGPAALHRGPAPGTGTQRSQEPPSASAAPAISRTPADDELQHSRFSPHSFHTEFIISLEINSPYPTTPTHTGHGAARGGGSAPSSSSAARCYPALSWQRSQAARDQMDVFVNKTDQFCQVVIGFRTSNSHDDKQQLKSAELPQPASE